MFEWSKSVMKEIKSKCDFSKNDLMTVERALRLYDVSTDILNYQVGLPDTKNDYELTMKIE